MKASLHYAIALVALTMATQAAAQITLYEREEFRGRSLTTRVQIENFRSYGFNDRASSVVIEFGAWEICDDTRFGGRCVVLGQGGYPSLSAMGLNNSVSSVRASERHADRDDRHYVAAHDDEYRRHDNGYHHGDHDEFHRRDHEQLYEANVTLVRAVVGPPDQRCWVEQEQVVKERRSDVNVPGAIAGAIIGGILGHQVGRGRGNDIATAGGAVAGAAVGANVGRDGGGQEVYSQDVQHCVNERSHSRPEYWDVSYNFRGQEHFVQLSEPPGPTVTVNDRGEPRE